MKLLKCLLCRGEMDVVNHERSINKHVKCRECGFSNETEQNRKGPEVVIIRRRPPQE
jgi:hypothetical protein